MVAPYVDYHCIVVKLPRLDLNVEMSWYHSLVQSMGQCVVTLLSMCYEAAGSTWMYSMRAQVVQVSTYAGESFGCAGMPIERFHFVCSKVTSG